MTGPTPARRPHQEAADRSPLGLPGGDRPGSAEIMVRRPEGRVGQKAAGRAPDVHFAAVFEAAPAAYLLLDPQMEIPAGNPAYRRATGVHAERVVGSGIFKVFPGDPAATGVPNLQASLRRALKFRRPDTMPVQQYDIPAPGWFRWAPRRGRRR